MKKYLLMMMVVFGTLAADAQKSDLEPCGFSDFNERDKTAISRMQANGVGDFRGTVYNVAVTANILGNDEGVGYFAMKDLLIVMCRLNEQMAESDLFFYLENVVYINESDWYVHESFGPGYQMMNQNNVPGTLNMYFVEDAGGACGYYSPSGDAIALSKSCSGPGNGTVAHEVGHYLYLPHTFSGWENNNTPSASNQEKVRRTGGANCDNAGDGFCDTPADYVAYRWSCPYNGPVLKDTYGDTLEVDGSLIMSYSDNACRTRFSPEQTNRMRGTLTGVRADIIGNASETSELGVAQLIKPSNGSIGSPYNYTDFHWERVPGAEKYLVVVSPSPLFFSTTNEFVATDTFVIARDLMVNRKYYWRVMAYSKGNTCSPFSPVSTFTTGAWTGLNRLDGKQQIIVSPNPAKLNTTINIDMSSSQSKAENIKVFDLAGKLLKQVQLDNKVKSSFNTSGLNAGTYLLQVITESGDLVTKKILLVD